MSETSDADVQALAGQIKSLREDFARVGRVVEEMVRRRGSAAMADAAQTAEKAWDEMGEVGAAAVKTMEQNPLATLAGAFGLGLLLGLLFGRR